VLEEYDRLVEEFGLQIVDAQQSISAQQRVVRGLVARQMEAVHA
jgi:hypothetical protein